MANPEIPRNNTPAPDQQASAKEGKMLRAIQAAISMSKSQEIKKGVSLVESAMLKLFCEGEAELGSFKQGLIDGELRRITAEDFIRAIQMKRARDTGQDPDSEDLNIDIFAETKKKLAAPDTGINKASFRFLKNIFIDALGILQTDTVERDTKGKPAQVNPWVDLSKNHRIHSGPLPRKNHPWRSSDRKNP